MGRKALCSNGTFNNDGRYFNHNPCGPSLLFTGLVLRVTAHQLLHNSPPTCHLGALEETLLSVKGLTVVTTLRRPASMSLRKSTNLSANIEADYCFLIEITTCLHIDHFTHICHTPGRGNTSGMRQPSRWSQEGWWKVEHLVFCWCRRRTWWPPSLTNGPDWGKAAIVEAFL